MDRKIGASEATNESVGRRRARLRVAATIWTFPAVQLLSTIGWDERLVSVRVSLIGAPTLRVPPTLTASFKGEDAEVMAIPARLPSGVSARERSCTGTRGRGSGTGTQW